MIKRPKALFYLGFLIFLIGFSAVFVGLPALGFLEITGLALALFAGFRWLLQGRLADKFRRQPHEDWLGFYLKKIIFRIWGLIFLAWMFIGVMLFIAKFIR